MNRNGGRTGWPPGLLQDDCRKLSKWFASKMDARQRVREACQEIKEANMIHNITDKERDLSKLLQNATQRINDLEAEVFEQARIIGMSTDREYALAGKIARQERALKLSLEAIEYTLSTNSEWFDVDRAQLLLHRAVDAIQEVLGETK